MVFGYHCGRIEDPTGFLLRRLIWCHCRESGSPELQGRELLWCHCRESGSPSDPDIVPSSRILDSCLRRSDTEFGTAACAGSDTVHHSGEMLRFWEFLGATGSASAGRARFNTGKASGTLLQRAIAGAARQNSSDRSP